MNASFVFGVAAVAASLAAIPANASVTTSKALLGEASPPSTLIVKADFVQGHEAIAGYPAREAATLVFASKQATDRYYNFDVIVTLGALAIASGAFAAAGIAGARRRSAEPAVAGGGWREQVMQAVEADLSRFTVSLRRAA